ncbi:DUF445 domain-containing protein [Ectothiorhodospiraceae bacterium WFHF3C12]|nr:DUF445 domain-containing protein [Ectothiorhodospiraceae bacterium WFHF3C12]
MSPAESDSSDVEQQRRLRRHKLFAAALLVAMAAVFVASHWLPPGPWWVGYIQAAAEAGVVGGLADWFAVTALFRHPMGLPIPHTAILPNNKKRIGEGLGRFVEHNFLAPDLVAGKIRAMDPAARLTRWLSRRRNADRVADWLAFVLPGVLRGIDDVEVRVLVERAAVAGLGSRRLQPLLAQAMRAVAASPAYQDLLDRLLAIGRDVLRENEDWVLAQVSERSRWWVPQRVDRRLAETLLASVEDLLDSLARPDHPIRRDFDAALAGAIDRFEVSPRVRSELEVLKTQWLTHPTTAAALGDLWDELREALINALERDRPAVARSLTQGLRRLAVRLRADPGARENLNTRVEAFVARALVPIRGEIGAFIAQVVDRWDSRTMSRRLELAVGRDLQYIRINGTLVGALVGAGLHALTHFL